MNPELLLGVIIQLIAPLLTVGLIKGLIRKAKEAIVGEVAGLGSGLKYALGLGVSFLFFVLVDQGFLPGSEALKGIRPELLALISKAIYDLFNDLLKKLKGELVE